MISRTCASSPLALSDSFKRVLDPDMKKRERAAGAKPQNRDTPSGHVEKSSQALKKRPSSIAHNKTSQSPATRSPPTRSPLVCRTPQKSQASHTLPSPLNPSAGRRVPGTRASTTLPSPIRETKGASSGSRTTIFSDKNKPTKPITNRSPAEGARDKRKIPTTRFREHYDKNDLPVRVFHGGNGGNRVWWTVDIRELEYSKYLPLFIDGLREKDNPYRLLAVQGTHDLLDSGGEKVLAVLPALIPPIRTALNTRDEEILITVMKMIQQMLECHEDIGLALVAYYRQLLPVFNVFKDCHRGCNDDWNYKSRLRQSLGETIEETLASMEKAGGDAAFINIKYSIPTYESCKGKVWCFNRN